MSNSWQDIVGRILRVVLIAVLGALADGTILGGRVAEGGLYLVRELFDAPETFGSSLSSPQSLLLLDREKRSASV